MYSTSRPARGADRAFDAALSERQRDVVQVVEDAGFLVLATVRENNGVVDIAFVTPARTSLVLRCVDRIEPEHQRSLFTMLEQGPFKTAYLVSRAGQIGDSVGARVHREDFALSLRGRLSV